MIRSASNSEIDHLKEMGNKSGLETVTDCMKYPFIVDNLKVLPYSFVKKHTVIPLSEEEGVLIVAISDPYNFDVVSEIRYITGSSIKEVLATKASIEQAIEFCYGQKDDTADFIENLDSKEELQLDETDQEYDLLDHESDSSVIKILNTILVEALNHQSSDIHFEPVEKGFVVRYRIDGILQIRHTLSREVQVPLTTRIKVLAKLDIAEHRLPQDGRIKLRMGGREIDFRVSTVPVVFGERVVLRILDRGQLVLGLDEIGMRRETLEMIRKQIRKNQGIILVTGPTGSGKTTTLYSMLSEIRSSEVNIMTIEDPVEFKLEGLAQISVNTKIHLSFSTGLRHILRQDPDVIMIGEIRDRDTAEVAVQASLTGHLVLSTLHTNDAPSAVARLVDMKIEPFLLSSSLIGVLAQRLVRKICPTCKVSYKPGREEIAELETLGEDLKGKGKLLCRGKGCPSCFHTGYKGRYGLYEFMPVTSRIKSQLLVSAESSRLQKIAMEEGMLGLRKEGILLAVEGITTLEEVLRVTRQLDDEVV